MTATLALSGTIRRGTPPMAAARARVWAPIQSPSVCEGEARGAHHRDEDLRLVQLAGQPVDDHRHVSRHNRLDDDPAVRNSLRFSLENRGVLWTYSDGASRCTIPMWRRVAVWSSITTFRARTGYRRS
jgi:hypothetical protein